MKTIQDTGPLYRETNMHLFVVEPYNTVTAVLFALLALYWRWKIRKEKQAPAIHLCLYLLLIGGIGGTLYHGTRQAQLFLVMDFLPILLSALVINFHLWNTLTKKGPLIFAANLIAAFVLRFGIFRAFSPKAAINGGYAMIALLILAPFLLYAKHTQWRSFWKIVLSVSLFCLALFCRVVDNEPWMPLAMGSHWLWHLFSFFSVAILLNYLFATIPRPASGPQFHG